MRTQKRAKDYRIAIQSICTIFNTISSELGADLSLNQIRILMQVIRAEAANEYIEMRDLCASLNLTRGAVSRSVAALTAKGYGGRKGLGLLTQNEDTSDRRVKRVSLTDRGYEFSVALGESARRTILDEKEKVVELIAEKSRPFSVAAGVDPDVKLTVYRVTGNAFSWSTYRQITHRMMYRTQHKIYHNEIIDMAVDELAIDDQEVQAFVEIFKRNSVKSSLCILANETSIYRRLKEVESIFAEAGISNISVHDNLSDIRSCLALPPGWRYPDLSPLIA